MAQASERPCLKPKRFSKNEKYLGLHLSEDTFFAFINQLEDFGNRWALEHPDLLHKNPFYKQRQDILENIFFN